MNPQKEYELIRVNENLRQQVIELLQENNLPVSDLDEGKHLFALLQNGEVVGTGGLELFNNCALLRSVSVKKDLQNRGLGKYINKELERMSKEKGIDCLYLLTTTAKDFFCHEGYEVVDREEAPELIKNTSEFSSVCPSTAVAMRKYLS
jgi:amino-acid N-acetyltransferase